ncbi:MAG: hypothetical protein NTZ50_03920 [Chloroflexi bacterium]|nr:hypothetical protein [Chloroflexota bacterium]
MSEKDLKNKWAVILGASSGLGAATAREHHRFLPWPRPAKQ